MKQAAALEEEAAKIEEEETTPEESMASKDRRTPRSRKWQDRRKGRQDCKPYNVSSRGGRGGGRGPPRGGRKGGGGITLSFGKNSRVWVKNYN